MFFVREEITLPPQRHRKLPNRSKLPQLRVSLHSELRNLRTPASVLPESILAKYRNSHNPRSGEFYLEIGFLFYKCIFKVW